MFNSFYWSVEKFPNLQMYIIVYFSCAWLDLVSGIDFEPDIVGLFCAPMSTTFDWKNVIKYLYNRILSDINLLQALTSTYTTFEINVAVKGEGSWFR